MKQLIVLVATVVLGVAIAGMVMGFRTTATSISQGAKSNIQSIFQSETGFN